MNLIVLEIFYQAGYDVKKGDCLELSPKTSSTNEMKYSNKWNTFRKKSKQSY